MGGMFTTLKVRAEQKPGDYSDPGAYLQPPGTQAYEVPNPAVAHSAAAKSSSTPAAQAVKPGHHHAHE